MQLRYLRAVLPIVLLAAFSGAFNVSSAQHRGSFFGSYEISNVADQGDRVQLTIKVVLLNYTGKDLKDCGIVLYNSAPVHSPLGSFHSIATLPVGGLVSLTEKFTVPVAQYASWKHGQMPVMEMSVPQVDGSSRMEAIELTPAPSPAAPID